MKKLLLCVMALLPLSAHAGKITLQLTETANGKTLCRYENSIYSFTITQNGKHCASVKTFDNEK
ncbi:hypothetical protein MUA02_11325 [Enterobacteriaceae bacterium H20N1]|uniref:Uncharacterized protein n=1 Tax=Dryocola boscaweniae TaxID=2925397 RepID=A0A9X3AQA2_9ENTR|nr:hypothetical protein [Dryocola boscaweniae]MCT4702455.1 hypothetical protein [Dryocola boscaweniae]MCT4719623.1 hypothetical protein [Dryocola boscaweniae]